VIHIIATGGPNERHKASITMAVLLLTIASANQAVAS
jgi:hypothetical protein